MSSMPYKTTKRTKRTLGAVSPREKFRKINQEIEIIKNENERNNVVNEIYRTITAYAEWEYGCESRYPLNDFLTIMDFVTKWINRKRSVESLPCLESLHPFENEARHGYKLYMDCAKPWLYADSAQSRKYHLRLQVAVCRVRDYEKWLGTTSLGLWEIPSSQKKMPIVINLIDDE